MKRLIVVDENALCIRDDEKYGASVSGFAVAQVLSAPGRGIHYTQQIIGPHSKVRPATRQDFDNFRVYLGSFEQFLDSCEEVS